MTIDGVLVATQSDLSSLPTIDLAPGASIRAMDHDDPADVELWLRVHNDAFAHAWTAAQFSAAVLQHRHIRVSDTYFLAIDGEVVGAASIGVFRRAEDIGVGHYLGVVPRAQGTGVARSLVAHRYRVLRDRGFARCESQTHLGRVPSLTLHFQCGFTPKRGLDEWNNPDTWSRLARWRADRRLQRLYGSWTRSHGAPRRSGA